MKKIICIILALMFIACIPLTIFAEEPEEEINPVGEEIVDPDPIPEHPPEEDVEEDEFDVNEVAQALYDRIMQEFPGGSAEIIAKLVKQWDETQKDGATLGDRLDEFFKPESIVPTVSMIAIVIILIGFGIIKKNQTLSIASTNEDLKLLKKELKDRAESEKETSDTLIKMTDALDKVNKVLDGVVVKIEESGSDSSTAKAASIAVASMVRNVFQNSRTLDEAGKKMVNFDYLKAIGEEKEDEV